jgi:hypothetical protein
MTATKEKRPASRELVELLSTRMDELKDAAEEIIRARAENLDYETKNKLTDRNVRRLFDREELNVFDALKWSDEQLRKELHRVANVVEWQEKAGTCADRQAAAERADRAAAALAAEGPQIDQQIAALQRKKASLENEHKQAAAVVARQNDACCKLRELVPPHVRAQVEAARQQARRQYEVPRLEGEISIIKLLPKMDRDQAVNFVRSHFDRDEQLQRLARDERGIDVKREWWQSYIAERTAELPRLERELAQLQAARAEAIAEANEPLDLYCR